MTFTESTILLLRNAPKERVAALFKRHEVPQQRGVEALVSQIGRDGANSIMTFFRGHGLIDYEAVVRGVAGRLKLVCHGVDVGKVEVLILEEVVKRFMANASKEEREAIDDVLNRASQAYRDIQGPLFKASLAAGSLTLLVQHLGRRIAAEIVSKILLRIAGAQVAKEAGKRAMQLAGMGVPALNVLLFGWTVWDLAGPAFRKTVPTVIEVALLRMEFGSEEMGT